MANSKEKIVADSYRVNTLTANEVTCNINLYTSDLSSVSEIAWYLGKEREVKF